jgi:bacterioferritin (cytochrome b1)
VSEFDKRNIILKSLQHYSKILASLLAKETLPEMVKSDLNNEYVKVYRVQSIVQTKGIIQKINEDSSLSILEIEAKVIRSALTCYIKDLKDAISELEQSYEKIVPLNETIKDKELANGVLEEISKIKTI